MNVYDNVGLKTKVDRKNMSYMHQLREKRFFKFENKLIKIIKQNHSKEYIHFDYIYG